MKYGKNIGIDNKMDKLQKINILMAQFLIHSYLYYILDHNVISDSEFDNICKVLLKHWDFIETNQKNIACFSSIEKSDLEAGSGYAVRIFPKRVQSLAYRIKEDNEWDKLQQSFFEIHNITINEIVFELLNN